MRPQPPPAGKSCSSFGTVMSGRSWSAESTYRYGFNGKEGDDEFSVVEGSYDFGERIYNSRVGQFLSMDPKSVDFPNYSTYQYAGLNPIVLVDNKGEKIILSFANSGNKKKYEAVTKTLFKDEVFLKLYQALDFYCPSQMPSRRYQGNPTRRKPYYFLTISDQAPEAGDANGSYSTDSKTINHIINHKDLPPNFNGQIKIKPDTRPDGTDNFNFGVIYEEYFHAYQTLNGLKGGMQNPITNEVEAKIAKMQAFVKMNGGLSAPDMKASMHSQGFEKYETDFLFDEHNNFRPDAVEYLKGSDMAVSPMHKVADEIGILENGVRNAYSRIDVKYSTDPVDQSFKNLNSLQK